MTFPHWHNSPSTPSVLSPGDVDAIEDAIEDIQAEWDQRRKGGVPDYGEIIDIALRRMQQDLDCENSYEVIEELRREIGYRQWCARASSAAAL